MLTITKLKGAEYLIRSVANGVEDYYMGAGEAPGVWRGAWATELGLEGVVEAEALRSLVNGRDPGTGVDLLAGRRERRVRAIDVTMSVPKSVSLLWAFGTPETSAAVSIAVVEATEVALGFLEERAAFARRQEGGVRRRVPTGGFAIATFAHRTSRAGDPQLHTHCLIPNVVRRADGAFVAFDANPLHTWAKATGTVFLNQLERLLTQRLAVAWGPERNGVREMVGFSREQLRAFSKRTVAIETHLEAAGELAFDSKRARMKADDRASLDTRPTKDRTLTPQRLRDRWSAEAGTVGLHPGPAVDRLVVGRRPAALRAPSERDVFAALVDPATGLCATESRFCEAHVVERIAALSGGRLAVDEIVELAQRFLHTELVVRLAPGADRRRPPEWSTIEHRAVEERLVAQLHQLVTTPGAVVDEALVQAAITAEPRRLGTDQAEAARVLCGQGPALRAMVAPAGYGKTTALHAAAAAHVLAGRRVVAVAPTHRAAAELRAAGLDAHTVARFLVRIENRPLAQDTTVIVDEVSQLGTRAATALLEAVTRSPGAQLWCVGDARQTQSVAAGGLTVELERLAAAGDIPAATLRTNRRQRHSADRRALAQLRAGDVDESRAIRTAHGWEHEQATPAETRQRLAEAAVADADRYGPEHVAALAVSHADCEDLADRIRAVRAARGELRGPALTGPGWGPETRRYAAGDRILIHTNRACAAPVFNGAAGRVLAVTAQGAQVLLDDGAAVFLPAAVIAGCRSDGSPNVSHAWARTVEGAQGGTWRQVHLLGTPALDRFTGYTGQSRGQLPTHTWNTRPDADHPASLLADQRTPGQVVADALRRAEPKTLAAADDPWVLDCRLRAERDEHAALVATRPPDLCAELEQARQELTRAEDEHRWASDGLALRQAERARLGLLTRLRRGGRDSIGRADQTVGGAQRRLQRAASALRQAQGAVRRLEMAFTERADWEHDHGWRLQRIADIDHTLAHHWAGIVLRGVRADNPLAFGLDRLWVAHATYVTDLQHILDDLPSDRRDQLADAAEQLRQRQAALREAEEVGRQARAGLGRAGLRRWGRRDKGVVERATAAVRATEREVSRHTDLVQEARERVRAERRDVDNWTRASKATKRERERLADAIRDIECGIAKIRRERMGIRPDPRDVGPPSLPGAVHRQRERAMGRAADIAAPDLGIGL